jgi:tetratricopeptide (TPR) repeat protein
MPDKRCDTCGAQLGQSGGCPQCETQVRAAVAPAHDSTSTRAPSIPGYAIIRSLGEGGMGAVYLAEESALGRHVAIKVVSHRIAQDLSAKNRFLREARTLATIEHAHVVRVYTFGEWDEGAYLIMEFVDGETLTDRITRLGRLPIVDALRIARQTVAALDAAWERKVVHRDIKPANILLDRKGNVRVADFGLAKPMQIEGDSGLTQSGLMVGTPHYISPEQAQGREVDFRSDVYSLGIVLYQMLSGERPFEGSSPFSVVAKHLHEPLPSLRLKRPDVSAQLEELVNRMTAKEPDQRPVSYEELATALAAAERPSTPSDSITISVPAADVVTPWNVDLAKLPVRKRILAAVGAVGFIWLMLYVVTRIAPNNVTPAKGAAVRDDRFIVAVAPFYGPDDDSAKEGRVMAALIERAVTERLGESANVLGIDVTRNAVRDHKSARDLAARLPADAVIWGEVFALRTETEIQPHVTVIEPEKPEDAESGNGAPRREEMVSVEALDKGDSTLRLKTEAPNQIELRKTSASGLGDLAVMLAGVHALQRQNDARSALDFLEQGSRSPENLRYRAQALIALEQFDEALTVLRESLAQDDTHAPTHAQIGDLLMFANHQTEAISAYRKAASIGKPFVATRAFVFDGRVYVKETYQSERYSDFETMYLLALDSSERVVARYPMPGVPNRFSVEEERVVISYEPSSADSREGEIILGPAGLDRPLWLPPSLKTRLRSMKSGWILASNFMGELGKLGPTETAAQFKPDTRLTADAPTTLPELETALRRAIDRDPTQPWHPFFLALTLREQNRATEAETVFAELLRTNYSGTPYYEFAWMAFYLERMQITAWADRLYPRIVEKRNSIPQPVGFSDLSSRLIDAPFTRYFPRHDLTRAHATLLRARTIGGVALEGEELAAAIWRDHFRLHGDDAASRREEDVLRQLEITPLYWLGTVSLFELTFSLFIPSMVALFVALVAILRAAFRRARLASERGLAPFDSRFMRVWTDGLPALHVSPASARIATIVVSAAAVGVWIFFLFGKPWVYLLMILALPLLVAHAQRVNLTTVASCVTFRERLALVAGFLITAVLCMTMAFMLVTASRTWNLPIAFGDTIGHESTVRDFEARLERDPRDELRYVTALANHYAGHRERAHDLYKGLAGYEPAVKNTAALKANQRPAAPLTPDDLSAAYLGSFGQRLRVAFEAKTLDVPPPIFIIPVLAFLVGVTLLVRPRRELVEELPGESLGWGRRLAVLIVPGLGDLREGRVGRAFAAILTFGFVMPCVMALILDPHNIFSASLAGLIFGSPAPNVFNSFPLPVSSLSEIHDLTSLRLSLPYAQLTFGVMFVATFVFLVLHGTAVWRMFRQPVQSS